ncbi:hypothetical protein K1T71_013557 [Dendrolimus kikuchii]|uniref:Uncharacterized protein n=1 Tax=Dendrolimus kikuchii TaxID=765133 RepID=A0ACC1CGY7_9NEOP|nr:hypothetical protein K1T71_013557 [Dendrolimus kikuchii]
MFLKPYGYDEIYKIIKTLNKTNAVGYDEVSTKIIKECATELTPIITYLINQSFEEGIFPDALKMAIVKPLFKKGDKNKVDNYRPITLVPILSKIFETAMKRRVSEYLDKNNILRAEQYGFQKGKSTVLACFNLVKNIMDNINDRNRVSVIFFDMSKAFDFVAHSLLLDKLENYGIRGPILNWFKSYLADRKQFVEILCEDKKNHLTGVNSEERYNRYGVPQGSVLGPLLFLIYINDLPNVITNKCFLFADDISVILTSPTHSDINTYYNDINSSITSITDWLYSNNLYVNLSKTKIVQFGTHQSKDTLLNITHNGVNISEETESRFLGITLDKYLSWKPHVNNVCIKINKFVYVLHKENIITMYSFICISWVCRCFPKIWHSALG